jgi:hypothetical protein
VLSEEFLATIDPGYHDHFLVKVRDGRYGNYAAVDFGPGSEVVITTLGQFASEPDSSASKRPGRKPFSDLTTGISGVTPQPCLARKGGVPRVASDTPDLDE